jgi:hypothetical protein
MDKEQLRKIIIDNSVGDDESSIDTIMAAIEQYKDACIADVAVQFPGAGNAIPTLKPLKWDDKFIKGEMRTKCDNSGFEYQISEGAHGLYYTDWRKNLGWNRIGNSYESIEDVKESCERHRNQRLRGQLQ